jgi:hypothetical protein
LTKVENDIWEVRHQFLENCLEVEKQEVEALEAEVRVKCIIIIDENLCRISRGGWNQFNPALEIPNSSGHQRATS